MCVSHFQVLPDDILRNLTEELPQPRAIPRKLSEYTQAERDAFPLLWTPWVASLSLYIPFISSFSYISFFFCPLISLTRCVVRFRTGLKCSGAEAFSKGGGEKRQSEDRKASELNNLSLKPGCSFLSSLSCARSCRFMRDESHACSEVTGGGHEHIH